MPRPVTLSPTQVVQAVMAAGAAGIAPDALEQTFPQVSRSTINRRLAALAAGGDIVAVGEGRALRYVATGEFPLEDIRAYLAKDWQQRPASRFMESVLAPDPQIPAERAARLLAVQRLARPLDRKFLADFLIDISWASSLLEGGTYSSLDTQALIEYGEKNRGKPLEDAVLILDHKNAIEYFWPHRELSVATLCELQSRLTDRHGLKELEDSDHFLPAAQRGTPREFEDVHVVRSRYSPPFRPGTGYVAALLAEVVARAATLAPVQAALYLMTRIPYLQAFANGNKRTARLAANIPLLAAGHLPISFVDFAKADYIGGMTAFYELANLQLMERVFIDGYVRSIVRGSDFPAAVRLGLDLDALSGDLAAFVYSGRGPTTAAAQAMLGRAP